jgi:hypothetical protein
MPISAAANAAYQIALLAVSAFQNRNMMVPRCNLAAQQVKARPRINSTAKSRDAVAPWLWTWEISDEKAREKTNHPRQRRAN